MAPSPVSAIAGRSGWANLAPIAYGTAAPIVASVPDSEPRTAPRIFRNRAYQFATEPESAATIAFGGSRSESSQTIRIGLTGLASSIAWRSIVPHHATTFSSIVSRHARSVGPDSSGSSARSVAAASPTRLTSVG